MQKAKVFPGLNKNARIERLPIEERDIVRILSREFYVTGGFNELKLNNSVYRYFFLKFPDDKAQAFGVRDEIIVLLSPFKKFEPRTLDAIEEIQDLNPGYRLDKICAFIISDSLDFIDELRKTFKTQKENRVITPFLYSEIRGELDDGFFRNRIREFFFERNLYDFDSPLRRDLYFFGRDDHCQSLVDKHMQGQNASLFGLRRSGKTSILLSVCRRVAAQGGFATLLDCQILYQVNWNMALYLVVDKINSDHKSNVKLIKENYRVEDAAMSFVADIRRIYKKLNKKILIAFDEIEQITFGVSLSDSWRGGESYARFWHCVRSLTQEQDNAITVLIAGTNPKCLETPFVLGVDNPLYGQITPEYIKAFSVLQTRQMIETLSSYMGIYFEEEIFTYLTREFGGHPFLIRQACSFIKPIVDNLPSRTVDRLTYETAMTQFSESRAGSFCEMVIGVLAQHYPDEYTMLTYLARGDIADFNDLAASDASYTNHLIGYGIISKSDVGYDFKIDAVKRHLEKKEKFRKINMTNEEKLSEIGLRRNDVEVRLRKLVAQVLKTKLGEESSREQILRKHDKKNRDKYNKLSYKDLFNPNKHEIYFNDLREIIRRNWVECFSSIFLEDVEKFNSRMTILNSIGRSDAHAKNVTDADMQSFRGAMEWLEERVDDYEV